MNIDLKNLNQNILAQVVDWDLILGITVKESGCEKEKHGKPPRGIRGSVSSVCCRKLLLLQTFCKSQNLPPKEWGGQDFSSRFSLI